MNVFFFIDGPCLCVYISSSFNRLMDDGGWGVLNLWLSDAKKLGNAPLLIEIIQVDEKSCVKLEFL